MVDNVIFRVYRTVKNVLGYQAPTAPDPFVLDENRPHDSYDSSIDPLADMEQSLEAFMMSLRFARRLESFMVKVGRILREGQLAEETELNKLELAALEKQFSELTPVLVRYNQSLNDPIAQRLSTSIEENKKRLSAIYRLPRNKDIIVRNIQIAGTPPVKRLLYLSMEWLTTGR